MGVNECVCVFVRLCVSVWLGVFLCVYVTCAVGAGFSDHFDVCVCFASTDLCVCCMMDMIVM